MAGPSVAVEPGSEIIRGRTNVDDPAVPDRLVLCDPWWLKRFRSVFCLTSLAGWLTFSVSSSVQCCETKKKKKSHCFTLIIYYCNMIINIVIIIHSEVLHCCYYC